MLEIIFKNFSNKEAKVAGVNGFEPPYTLFYQHKNYMSEYIFLKTTNFLVNITWVRSIARIMRLPAERYPSALGYQVRGSRQFKSDRTRQFFLYG